MPRDTVTLFLCGDAMTGRGVDQILPHPNAPELHEPYVRGARENVELAEQPTRIPRPVEASYIWGEALGELDRLAPAARVINLETSGTGPSREGCAVTAPVSISRAVFDRATIRLYH